MHGCTGISPIEKESNYYQRLFEIGKENVREVARGDVNNYLRKSADRKAQIINAVVPLTGLFCALRSADFLR